VRLPTLLEPPAATPFKAFDVVHDTMVFLRFVDAHGSGHMQDLLFVYHTPENVYFGVVVRAGQAYPLTGEPATGAIARAATLETLVVAPQQDGRPRITAYFWQGARRLEVHFVWDGTRFVHLPSAS
jgi:hypothetical protein